MGCNDGDHNAQSMCYCEHVPTSLVITPAFHVTTSEDGYKISSLLQKLDINVNTGMEMDIDIHIYFTFPERRLLNNYQHTTGYKHNKYT